MYETTAGHTGWTGYLAAVWALAGGVAGGAMITLFVLAGRMHPDAALLFAAVAATLGSVLGAVHGAVLGRLSGPSGQDGRTSFTDTLLNGLLVICGIIGSVLLAMWLTLGAMLARIGNLPALAGFAVALAISGVILAWGTSVGWRAMEIAYERWPEHRLGGRLLLGAFAVIATAFLALRPAIPGTELQLPVYALFALAALAALWLAAPAIVFALRLRSRRPDAARRQLT